MKTIYRCCFAGLLAFGLFVMDLYALEPDTPIQNADVSYLGAINYGYAGWSISSGDVDGDGLKDFLIGGSEVYLILGKNMGQTSGNNIEDFADASFIRENSGQDFGYEVCMAGDVNNDGYDDILIGACRYNSSTGKTYLVLGKAAGWAMNTNIMDIADSTFTGEEEGGYSGYGIVFEDVNNDGYDDIFIGAYMLGKTYLFYGNSDGWGLDTSLASADAFFERSGSGRYLTAAGDVNADGYDDVLIASSSVSYLLFGRETEWAGTITLSSSADAAFSGGGGAASACDLNNDGYNDLLIGTNIIFGKEDGWNMYMSADASFTSEVSGDHLGDAVFYAGDVNNDGFDDFLIGATWSSQYTGKTYLIYGRESGWGLNTPVTEANASFVGENTYDYSGFNMAPAGDINGDGNGDFLISAAYFGPRYTGKVYLFISDEAIYGDLDMDRDVDATDLALFCTDINSLEIEKFARQLGYNNG